MPDDPPSAKKLIKKCLKTGPQPVADVRAVVLQKLVADGKAKKKAEKLIEAKLQLPCFALGADNILRLAGADDAKRSAGATASAPPSKKAKVEARRSPRLAAAAADATGVPALALQQPAASGKAPTMVGAAVATAFFKEHNIELSGRGADGFRPVAAFADTGFGANVLRACASFSKPTPIQAVCWPIAASGRDTVGVAETGSGKTLAFILPALELVGRARARGEAASGVQVLVLAPTRELAMQSDAVCAAAAKGCGFNSICVYGGVPKPPQREAIRKGAEVVIATPGRLLDLNSEGAAPLGNVSFLVLDEARRSHRPRRPRPPPARPHRAPSTAAPRCGAARHACIAVGVPVTRARTAVTAAITAGAAASPGAPVLMRPDTPRAHPPPPPPHASRRLLRRRCIRLCGRRTVCSTWASRRTCARSSASLRPRAAP